MAAQTKKNEKKTVEVVPDPPAEDKNENEEEHDDNGFVETQPQQEKRQQEWGQQFDKWLINAARREKTIDILLSLPYPGFSAEGNIVTGVPKRIDKDFIQLVVNSKEVWIQKAFIVGCTLVVATSTPSNRVVEL